MTPEEQLRELIHRCAHDLRTPLTAIMASAEMLDDEIEDPELKQLAANALAASKRMAAMICAMVAEGDKVASGS
jgi:signal transduction histidine kinase